MATNNTYWFVTGLMSLVLSSLTGYCQRINFGTWAGSNITIQAVTVNSLNFGNVVRGVSTPKSIEITGATAYAISAPEGFDLTVTVTSPTSLDGPDSKTIPLNLKFAYSNQGLPESSARLNTVEVPTLFNIVTFPILRNTMGLPTPPPTPQDKGSAPRTTATAYLYLYGSAGPAGNDAAAGEYSGTVNIAVEVAGL